MDLLILWISTGFLTTIVIYSISFYFKEKFNFSEIWIGVVCICGGPITLLFLIIVMNRR